MPAESSNGAGVSLTPHLVSKVNDLLQGQSMCLKKSSEVKYFRDKQELVLLKKAIMRVAFRVDASEQIGIGHLIRCMVLADQLVTQGVSVQFVCVKSDEQSYTHLELVDHPVIFLEKKCGSRNKVRDHISPETIWPLDQQEVDAVETIRALSQQPPCDWLVVDHYGLDMVWENSVRVLTQRIMVIDDLANRHHDCDLLLDQGYCFGYEDRYSTLLKKNCRVALGPGYALLAPEYRQLRRNPNPSRELVRNILVCFGGSDQKRLYRLVVEAFESIDMGSTRLTVVLGGSSQHLAFFERLTHHDKRVCIYKKQTTLASFMATADLFVGSIGMTTWERCCLGIPTIAISLADNQEQIAERLNSEGVIKWVGNKESINCGGLKEQFLSFLETADTGIDRDRQCTLVDGRGVLRIVTALYARRAQNVEIRPAVISDEEELLHWVNDPEATRFSFRGRSVEYAEHKEWFRDQLASIESEIFIGQLEDGMPIGQIRFSRQSRAWIITYSIESSLRGLGYGKQLLEKGIEAFRDKGHTGLLCAEVHEVNSASVSLFSNLNFSKVKGKKPGLIEFEKT